MHFETLHLQHNVHLPSLQARKLSSENLAGGGKESPVGPGPVRATSLEDIPTFATHATPLSAPAQRIVDAVVKLYVPDHTYKYLDISPVSGDSCNQRPIISYIAWVSFTYTLFLPLHPDHILLVQLYITVATYYNCLSNTGRQMIGSHRSMVWYILSD